MFPPGTHPTATTPIPPPPDPRADDGHDPMSYDKVISVPRDHDSDDHMSFAVAGIERRLAEIDRELAACAPLVRERDRLLQARAAALGEPPPTISATRRITRADVLGYLAANPGSRAGQIARGLRAGQPAVSAHLYRGRGELFVNRAGRWYVTQPMQPLPSASFSR